MLHMALMPDRLDQIYTADEAAERLRLTKRALIKIARRSGHCSRAGRDLLFSEADLLAIWQDIREAPMAPRARPPANLPSQVSQVERLRYLLGPPIKVDRRVIRVLQHLNRQTVPRSHLGIDGCGPRTIDGLLVKGFVTDCGRDAAGLITVRISASGRDQVREYERWLARRAKDKGR